MEKLRTSLRVRLLCALRASLSWFDIIACLLLVIFCSLLLLPEGECSAVMEYC
jgi:hypothetical protein